MSRCMKHQHFITMTAPAPSKRRLSNIFRSLSKARGRDKSNNRAERRARKLEDKKAEEAARIDATINDLKSTMIEPKHQIVGAKAGLQDHRSEDVADRNIARERFFPPRVSSAAYTESKPGLSAPKAAARLDAPLVAVTALDASPALEAAKKIQVPRPKSKPLIPSEDKYQAGVADWNNMQYRSPFSVEPASVPSPLTFKKHTGSPKACVFGDD